MNPVNRKVVLVSRPTGRPDDSNFAFVEEAVTPLIDGQVLVAVDLLGIDAFIRTTLDEGSFHRGARLGGVIPALGVGEVLDSRDAGLAAGDKVFGPLGSQTHAVMPAAALRKLDTGIAPRHPELADRINRDEAITLIRDGRGAGRYLGAVPHPARQRVGAQVAARTADKRRGKRAAG